MVMDLSISTLNPYAPAFDPVEFREVEDFSTKWWELVKTSKWFRDFWLCANSEDEFGADEFSDVEDQFDEMIESAKTTGSPFISTHDPTTLLEALNVPESPKARRSKSPEFSPKHHKPAKYVTPKFNARRTRQICQPR